MENDYKSMYRAVYIHFEKSKRLFLNPIGLANDSRWGTVAIPPFLKNSFHAKRKG